MDRQSVNFENIIPASLAREIAESQHDLGGISKDHIVCCLSFSDTEIKEITYQQLDPLSRIIVATILGNDSSDGAVNEIDYMIHNLKSFKASLLNSKDNLYTF